MGDQDGTDDIQNNTDETSWKKGDKRCFISCQIVPWSQRLSFILSFLFGNLRREALIEAPSPREKKASCQDR